MLTKEFPTRNPSQLPTLVISDIGPEKFTVILIGTLKQNEYKYAYALIVDKNKEIISAQEILLRKDPIYVTYSVFEKSRVIGLIEEIDELYPELGFGYGINLDNPDFSEPGEIELDSPYVYRIQES
ncbi:hypothetical protein [Thermococcus barophilus]|uniref:Uncharacterized protein n=1 Tax=Thermococcus barophilus TaxID=55802 RepID=A0A0S1XDC6_THEBA|nr:hypothetical protein [Thermococcus barophilus]ALM75747.1 hypothetical protein TBCH5v1_1838 [Thermococcus barophilus]